MSRPPFSSFPPARPLPVEGGLKARSRRGRIAQSWWSHRFVSVLEDAGLDGRLQRGRAYARKGQVVSLEVQPGSVTALVQGSRTTPYRVRIGIRAYGKADWAAVERELAGSAWYLAALLAGDMPEDIEEVFSGRGLPLFPASADELSLDCSCPDWEVPCKHVAAALYLLAETFDEDPFSILAWRGRERADLMANLRAARAESPGARDETEAGEPPLEDLLETYYRPAAVVAPRAPGARAGTALPQLPDPGLAVRGRSVVELLEPVYRSLSDPDA